MILLFSCVVFSQVPRVSGYVKDAATGEPLIGATVYIVNSTTGSTTNRYGYYSILCPKGDTGTVSVSYIGYQTVIRSFNAVLRDSLNFRLQSRIDSIGEVEVVYQRRIEDLNALGRISIPMAQVAQLPLFGSGTDIMKALQLMPGIQSGKEGGSGLFVRGGTPDQNLIILDGIPLYNVSHLGGFISIFNTNAINDVTMLKAGFPARYGGRISSVMEVSMKEGNNQEFSGNATIGLLHSDLSLEGPLKKDTSSYIITLRRFIPDLIMRPLRTFTNDLFTGYSFYDANVKLNYQLNSSKIYLSYYGGNDKITTKFEDLEGEVPESSVAQTKWGNQVASFRWNRVYRHSLFSNMILYWSRYNYKSGSEYVHDSQTTINQYESGVNDLGFKYDFELSASMHTRLRFGTSVVHHSFTPGISSYTLNIISDTTAPSIQIENFKAFEGAVYLEDQFKFGSLISGNLGYRFSLYNVNQTTYTYHEPRVLLNLHLLPNWSLKSSYTSMHQYAHLLTYSGLGMPSDLWMPSTDIVMPVKSQQYSVGIAGTIREAFEITLEGYYKDFENLISLKEGILFYSGSGSWQDKIETGGIGYSKGIEFLIRKRQGTTTGWIGYTLAKTGRKFESINDGAYYPYKYDRRHAINIVMLRKINEHINISATWTYGSGYTMTMPYEAIQTTGIIPNRTYPEAKLYEKKNNFRMENYHRLDLGANFTKSIRWGERVLSIGIYNVYNRKNPYYYFTMNSTNENITVTKLYKYTLFPVSPSISYTIRF